MTDFHLMTGHYPFISDGTEALTLSLPPPLAGYHYLVRVTMAEDMYARV